MAELELRLFGLPQVCYAGVILTFPTRKALALLVYLAAEPGQHRRDQLTELFWPASSPEQGGAAFRNTLSRLRHVLQTALGEAASQLLLVEREIVGFARGENCQVDLQILEEIYQKLSQSSDPQLDQLRKAVTVYRGDFLEGFNLDDAPGFEQWAAGRREYWQRRANVVFEQLAEKLFECGEYNAALETARRWLAFDELNETVYRLLIRLYLANGEPHVAKRIYEQLRAVLEREFQTKPAEETQVLLAKINENSRANRARPEVVTVKPTATPSQLPLTGRSLEHAQLVAAYRAAAGGNTQTVVLTGEAGIGKTRLASDFAHWASSTGADILRGRAFETGGRLPYEPLLGALRSRLELENAPDDLLADVWLSELSRLLPELRERYPDLPEGAVMTEAEAKGRLFEAVTRLIQALAQRTPLVVLLDDIHWADSAALDLLQYLGRRLSENQTPVLFVLTVRTEELAGNQLLAGWLTAQERETSLTKLKLSALAASETTSLLAAFLGGNSTVSSTTTSTETNASPLAQFGDWLFRETGGQPFFILETLKALLELGVLTRRGGQTGANATYDFNSATLAEEIKRRKFLPPGIREVLKARLNRLAASSFNLLVAGAVLDHAFSFEQLCQVAAVDLVEGLDKLDELLEAGLLREFTVVGARASLYSFSHNKIRDVVYTEARDARRRFFHRRAFEMLAQAKAAPAILAHHATIAGLDKAAFDYSLQAGEAAFSLFATRDAISYFEQAEGLLSGVLEPDTTRRLYLPLGRAYELVGDQRSAARIYRQLLEIAIREEWPELEAAALSHLATLIIIYEFEPERAKALLAEAVKPAKRSGQVAELAHIEWNLAQLALYNLKSREGLPHAIQALKLAEELGQAELVARSINILAYLKVSSGLWVEAVADAERGVKLYAALGNRAMEADCLNVLAEAQLKCGRPQEAKQLATKAYSIYCEIADLWGQVVSLNGLALALLELAEYEEALANACTGTEIARQHGQPMLLIFNLVLLGNIYRATADFAAARSVHLEALNLNSHIEGGRLLALISDALCADYAVVGEWQEASRYALHTLDPENGGILLFMSFSRWWQIEALLRGGFEAAARADLQRFEELANGSPRYRLIYRRCQAVVAQWEGQPDLAQTYLKDALLLAAELGLPGEQKQIEMALN